MTKSMLRFAVTTSLLLSLAATAQQKTTTAATDPNRPIAIAGAIGPLQRAPRLRDVRLAGLREAGGVVEVGEVDIALQPPRNLDGLIG